MNLEMYRHNADAGQTAPGSNELLDAETPLDALPTRRQMIRRRVFWAVGGIVAAAMLVGIAAVVILRDDSVVEINAQWTAEPSAVSDADLAVAVAACSGEESLSQVPMTVATTRVLASERRGNAVAILFDGNNEVGGYGSCLVALAPGSKTSEVLLNGWSGRDGTAPEYTPEPDELLSEAMFGSEGPDGPNAMTGGGVGANVAGVTLYVGDLAVTATVANGNYLLWWPQGELDENGNYLVPDTGAEEYEEFFGTEQDMTYDLHLKDGTTLAGLDFWAIDDDDPGVLATAE